MHVALLFDPTSLIAVNCDYGRPIRDRLLGCGLLQSANKAALIRVGDLLYYKVPEHVMSTDEVVLRLEDSNAWPGQLKRPLATAVGKHRVFVYAIRGLDMATVRALTAEVWKEEFYIGAYGLRSRDGLQRFLLHSLPLNYVLRGGQVWTCYEDERAELEDLGFARARYVGEAPEHFRRWAWEAPWAVAG